MNYLNKLVKFKSVASSLRTFNPILCINFSSTNFRFAKKFVNSENEFAHNIFVENPKYLNISRDILPIVTQPFKEDAVDYFAKSCADLAAEFEKAAHYCKTENVCLSSERFDGLVDAIVKNCDNFSDDEIIHLLKCLHLFPETESPKTRNFLELWSALNDTCVDRIRDWKTDQLLYVADHWYVLNLSKIGKYTWQALRKLSRNIRRLKPEQLVQTMFYINLTRKGVENMIDFEMSLNEYMDAMTLDEISVLCVGFFKTKTPLRQLDVIQRVYRRLISEADTVKDIPLTNILKALRYSSTVPLAPVIEELLDVMTPQISRLSLLSCLHLALLGTNFQKCHKQSLSLIIHRFENELSTARLKDIERIVFVMGLYDLKSDALCEHILVELKTRFTEIARHPKCFASCLHYLSMCGHGSGEMISAVLDRSFIKEAYGPNWQAIGREIFSLDAYTQINLKGTYDGNQLSESNRRLLAKFLSHFVPVRDQKYKMSLADRLLLEVEETTESCYGKCVLLHALPHFEKPDIFMLYDKTTKQVSSLELQKYRSYSGKILTTEALMPFKEDLQAKNIDGSNLQVIAIVVAGWNAFVRDTGRPTGVLKMRLEQLRLIGHAVVLVPWLEWTKLNNSSDKETYIKNKVEAAVA